MSNFPGPFELRIFYNTNEPVQISSHVLRLSLRVSGNPQPGDPFTAIQTLDKTGSPGNPLSAVLTDLLAFVRPFYVPLTDFIRAELWRYPTASYDAVFVSAQVVGLPGTGTGTTVVASQFIMTFRTAAGGIFKVDLRGTIVPAQVKRSFPFGSGAWDNLANHILLPITPFIGRDNSVPVSPLFALPGQNERAWKRVHR